MSTHHARGAGDTPHGPHGMEGLPVYDTDGEKVGSVYETYPGQDYMRVQKGTLFPRDLYIPIESIERTDTDGVYLSLHRDDLSADRYHHVPDAGADTDATGTASGTPRRQGTDDAPGQPARSIFSASAARGSNPGEQATDGGMDANGDDTIRVPLVEEQLFATTREVEAGHVHIHKDVVRERRTVSDLVSREVVVLESVAVPHGYDDLYLPAGPDAFMERDIDIVLVGERLMAQKHTVAVEEVRVHVDRVTEEQEITDTVRKERVTVDSDGDLTRS